MNAIPQWLRDGAEQVKLEARRVGADQANRLIDAGWKYELPELVNGWKHTETEPWQWYWRAPPKRAGNKGRRYLSTQQAINALDKAWRKEAGL